MHGRIGTVSVPESPEVSNRAFPVAMQEDGSLKGPPLVSESRYGKGKAALPFEETAPQQAEAPGSAEQGLGTSDEPGRAAPAEAPEMQSPPAVLAAATGDALERGKGHESSEGAVTASGGRAGKPQAASTEPFTLQQQAVLAALMVVLKRAKLEGHVAYIAARARMICNNRGTMAVVQYIGDGEGLPSMSRIEQMLQRDNWDLLDLLAVQCNAAGFRPLQVFNRSVQCGAITECKAAHSRGAEAALTRHQQVAELYRHFEEQSTPTTWSKGTFKLLVWREIPEPMAELIMLLPLLLAGLCKRCFRPSDTGQDATVDYAALDHLFPGSCHCYLTMIRHEALVAAVT